jgi:peptidoglycan hydrolase-like protein with peptidoglycan-binding domain
MGQAWALWLHIEFLDTRLNDGRSIEAKLGGVPPVINPPNPNPPVIIDPQPTPPVLIPGSSHMLTVNITTVRRGSTGGRVKKMQGLVNANFIDPSDPIGYLTEDGHFGARTEERIKAIQAFFGMTVDGIVGPKTWEILINIPLT